MIQVTVLARFDECDVVEVHFVFGVGRWLCVTIARNLSICLL